MVKAIEIQKNIRKQQCCILVVVIVVIGIIVGVVIATQGDKGDTADANAGRRLLGLDANLAIDSSLNLHLPLSLREASAALEPAQMARYLRFR